MIMIMIIIIIIIIIIITSGYLARIPFVTYFIMLTNLSLSFEYIFSERYFTIDFFFHVLPHVQAVSMVCEDLANAFHAAHLP